GSQTRPRSGRIVDDLADLDAAGAAELAREPRRERSLLAAEAEVGAPEAALAHQRADDSPRRRIDRDGQAEPDSRDGGVDADDPAAAVGERAAGVARVER